MSPKYCVCNILRYVYYCKFVCYNSSVKTKAFIANPHISRTHGATG